MLNFNKTFLTKGKDFNSAECNEAITAFNGKTMTIQQGPGEYNNKSFKVQVRKCANRNQSSLPKKKRGK